jgi:flagellar hook-basal body protein
MIRAMWTAATGMTAQQLNVDTIANNLANVNTNAFKRSRAEFGDLLYQIQRLPGTNASNVGVFPVGVQVGGGVRPITVAKEWMQGQHATDEQRSRSGHRRSRLLPSGQTGWHDHVYPQWIVQTR